MRPTRTPVAPADGQQRREQSAAGREQDAAHAFVERVSDAAHQSLALPGLELLPKRDPRDDAEEDLDELKERGEEARFVAPVLALFALPRYLCSGFRS